MQSVPVTDLGQAACEGLKAVLEHQLITNLNPFELGHIYLFIYSFIRLFLNRGSSLLSPVYGEVGWQESQNSLSTPPVPDSPCAT